jgi:hypothetical protein
MNIKELALQGHPVAQRVMDAFNADQERDELGRWLSGGGPGTTASETRDHVASAQFHAVAAKAHYARGEQAAGKAHEEAARLHTTAAEIPSPSLGRFTSRKSSVDAQRASSKANAESTKVGGKSYAYTRRDRGY